MGSHIWDLANESVSGQLNLGEFICAMALVARRRQGLPLPASLPPELALHLGLSGNGAQFEGIADSRGSSPPGTPLEGPPLESEELERYRAMFRSMDQNGVGSIGPDEGRDLLEKSGLPVGDLSHIWRVSDVDGDGRLTEREFVCAMALTARRRQGAALPMVLPRELVVVA